MGRIIAVGVTSGHGRIMGYAECSPEDASANELSDFEHAPADMDVARKADFVHHRGGMTRRASLSSKSASGSLPG